MGRIDVAANFEECDIRNMLSGEADFTTRTSRIDLASGSAGTASDFAIAR